MIYCVVGKYATMAEVVKCHREVTAETTSTRRSANCFNFLRQLQVLEKAGDAGLASFKDARNKRGKIFFLAVSSIVDFAFDSLIV